MIKMVWKLVIVIGPSGVISRLISKSDEREARLRPTELKFNASMHDYSLNCTTRGPITN